MDSLGAGRGAGQGGLALLPLGPGPMEVDSAEQVPEDGATAGETADEETNSSLAHTSPS